MLQKAAVLLGFRGLAQAPTLLTLPHPAALLPADDRVRPLLHRFAANDAGPRRERVRFPVLAPAPESRLASVLASRAKRESTREHMSLAVAALPHLVPIGPIMSVDYDGSASRTRSVTLCSPATSSSVEHLMMFRT